MAMLRTMLYFILLPITTISLSILGIIAWRHWKELRLLDPDSIQQERERQKREELLLQRFTRLKTEKLGPLKTLVQRGIMEIKRAYHAVYLKLVKFEKFYKQAKAPFAMLAPSVRERIKLLLDDARSLMRDLKWADAERRFLEVLNIDKHNTAAYKGLGVIYLKQKLYPQARETFSFLIKTRKADETCYAALAEIALSEENVVEVENMRRKAIESSPRLAHRHAELAEFYLSQNQPSRAWPFAKRASELEAKSAKYLELSLETAILVGDRNEAKRRYDKLRLLSDDHPKLQALKDKIERSMPA